jgi:hypothetical protein
VVRHAPMGICAGCGVRRMVVERDLQDEIVLSVCMKALVEAGAGRANAQAGVSRRSLAEPHRRQTMASNKLEQHPGVVMGLCRS